MKKIIITIITLCIGVFCANAETHLNDPNNVLYVCDASGQSGHQTTLSVGIKNKVAISGFQFELYLPDGMEVDHEISKFGDLTANAQFSEERGNPAKFSFQAEFPEEGNYSHLNVVCYSMEKTLIGDDGEVAVITVNIGNHVAAGSYPITLKNAVISHGSDVYRSTKDIVCTITITAAALPGDANGDSRVSIADVTTLVDYLTTGNTTNVDMDGADADGSGSVGAEDVEATINILLEK